MDRISSDGASPSTEGSPELKDGEHNEANSEPDS